MRSSLLTVLASTALLVSATEIVDFKSPVTSKSDCVYNAIQYSNIDCDVDSILECFEAESSKDIVERIQQCLMSTGCISREYINEAYIWENDCRPMEEVQEEVEEGKELRRRKDASTTETSDTSTSEATTTSTSATSTSDTTTTTSSTSSTSTTASAAATTTVASSTTSSSTTTTSGSTLSTSTTSSSSSTTTTTAATSNSCFDYSTTLTSNCWTASGASTSTCVATTSTASSCANGMYCATSTSDADVTCMVLDNNLTASGTAVAVVFGTAIATFIITMISCAFKDSRAASARKRALEAALEADAKNALVAGDVEAAKRRTFSMGPVSGGPQRSRSPLSGAQKPLLNGGGGGDGEDTRNLLGGGNLSRQPSPNPSLQQGQRSLTGGSGTSSPSRSEDGAYHEARH